MGLPTPLQTDGISSQYGKGKQTDRLFYKPLINSEPMWHARAAKGTTIEFEELVEHMSEHKNPPNLGESIISPKFVA